MNILWTLLYWITFLFFLLMLGRLVLSLVQSFSPRWSPQGPVLVLAEFIYSLTDPPLKAVGRFVPPLRIGNIALDLAFLIVILVTSTLMQIFRGLAEGG
ncbi:MAG: hypothetical protein CSA58_05005 [Micrococcales bacterium]|nr:MAG: hypothetical protein CSB46_06440 [Micrococcales bacterium]PIE27319.1 MAG: hypothetical protein CSA58_05005 [Micrococcales bacterium]